MPRNRIIYQSEALYAGKTGDTSPVQLHRIQDVSHSVEVARQDVNEFGKLAALSTEIIEPPTVGLDFNYYIVDGYNEGSGLGFIVQGYNANVNTSMFSGIIGGTDDYDLRNYYVLTVPEGQDASQGSAYTPSDYASMGVIGIGNGQITSYGIEASVGDIPTASVSVEADNIRFDTSGAGFQNPAINTDDGNAVDGTVTLPLSTTGNLSAAALRPGDITITFGAEDLSMGGAILPGMTRASVSGSANIQNFSIDVPLSRTPIQEIGTIFPSTRALDFPILGSLSVNANLTDISEGNLRDLICNEARKRTIQINMKNRCGASNSIVYNISDATLDSQNFSSSMGDNKSVDLSFSFPIEATLTMSGVSPSTTGAPTTTTTAAPTTTTTTAAPTTTTTAYDDYCSTNYYDNYYDDYDYDNCGTDNDYDYDDYRSTNYYDYDNYDNYYDDYCRTISTVCRLVKTRKDAFHHPCFLSSL